MADKFLKIFNGANFDPQSADPSNPAEGDIQFSDGTARTIGLWQYHTGAWQAIGGGSSADPFDVVSSSGAVSATNGITYLIDTSGGTSTITLPSPSANAFVRVKDKGNAETNNITINPNAAETIDGASSHVINSNYGSAVFVSDGTNWFIL